MSERMRIAVVDDDVLIRTLLGKILEESHEMLLFDSGERFLASGEAVDALLLDIEMTGISGYEVCRQFRMREDHDSVPVIFISSHDQPEQRLAAFESGGDDFILKPIVRNEVRHKVETLLSQQTRLRELRSESDMARQMAFSAMSSMGDLGIVLEFMKASATSADYRGLGEQLSVALANWGLRGSLQIRGRSGTFQRATESEQYPLQGSVMETLKDMGRIFQMGSRGIINYPHVSILVQNLPVDQPDKVGQLRDLLAMLAESADARVEGMDLQQQTAVLQDTANQSQAALAAALEGWSGRVRHAQGQMAERLQDALEDVFGSLKSMCMTPVQEAMIRDLMQAGVQDANQIIDQLCEVAPELMALQDGLKKLSS